MEEDNLPSLVIQLKLLATDDSRDCSNNQVRCMRLYITCHTCIQMLQSKKSAERSAEGDGGAKNLQFKDRDRVTWTQWSLIPSGKQ